MFGDFHVLCLALYLSCPLPEHPDFSYAEKVVHMLVWAASNGCTAGLRLGAEHRSMVSCMPCRLFYVQGRWATEILRLPLSDLRRLIHTGQHARKKRRVIQGPEQLYTNISIMLFYRLPA